MNPAQKTEAPGLKLYQLTPAADASPVSDKSKPVELIEWMFDKFTDRRLLLTTSFGMEGCSLIDMCVRAGGAKKLTVAWIDTGFFFPETIALRDRIARKYPDLTIRRWASPVSVEQQSQSYGDELWKDNPNQCCHIRKVVPMKDNIVEFDLWMTGLRRSQTRQRADHPVMFWDWRYQILKFCPLASWTREEVWKYVKANAVPFNPLHLQNYPSVGCTHCTRPVPGSSPESDDRDGRWDGSEKTECGLHFSI
ncbi:MAG: phosphoadenylyl-sulfate reductase [Planctomycetota bacterium]